MIVKEIYAKTILSKSKVQDYTINPYIGCQHACTYCYARFIKRFTGHKEPWGEFVDVKINAPSLLAHEIKKKKRGRVWVSGLCDPYQPLETKYEVTRKCLEILSKHDWSPTVQTKSPLVLRDIDLLRNFNDVQVTVTVTTADEGIRRIFEPNAPSVMQRLETLEKLHAARIKTSLMIAPVLPMAENLVTKLSGKVDHAIIDKMNYHHADWVYRKYGLEYARNEKFLSQQKTKLVDALTREGIPHQLLF